MKNKNNNEMLDALQDKKDFVVTWKEEIEYSAVITAENEDRVREIIHNKEVIDYQNESWIENRHTHSIGISEAEEVFK